MDMISGIEQDYFRRHNVQITPGKLVSELNFGFWTTLLSFPYDSRIWRWNGYALLAQAFPHTAGHPLAALHARFNEIRFLRNRVMHYEAIYHRPNLAVEHAHVHEAIQWISPQFHKGVHTVDNFPDVLAHGRMRVYAKFHDFLGGP
jgi:hypothetical protein